MPTPEPETPAPQPVDPEVIPTPPILEPVPTPGGTLPVDGPAIPGADEAPSEVPEPQSIMLLAGGLGLIALLRRRQKARK